MNIWQPGSQAEAVKAMLKYYLDNNLSLHYDGPNGVWGMAPWVNGREIGYVISARKYFSSDQTHQQLNIAFFEHRNSDALCAIKWIQTTFNPPTIETAKFGDEPGCPYYEGKYDVSFDVGYGQIIKMADWIETQFTDFGKNHEEGT